MSPDEIAYEARRTVQWFQGAESDEEHDPMPTYEQLQVVIEARLRSAFSSGFAAARDGAREIATSELMFEQLGGDATAKTIAYRIAAMQEQEDGRDASRDGA